jgi:tRNA (mo5U34)-methyltransferase
MQSMNNNYTDIIKELSPWFHNLHLPDGSQTASDHFLGDFPNFKWEQIKDHIPADLSGSTALDIGCNAGFYSFELAKRGADVLGIDLDPHYLKQANWAAEIMQLHNKIEFRQMQVYDLAKLNRKFDIIIFMGVLYHLRYPLLAVDIISQKVDKLLVFQTLTMPGNEVFEPNEDTAINEREDMLKQGYPKMAFIEHKLAGDPTNWWAPNHAAILSMLRSCGLTVINNPAHEIYICHPNPSSSVLNWNYSEYLSATGGDWMEQLQIKINKKK